MAPDDLGISRASCNPVRRGLFQLNGTACACDGVPKYSLHAVHQHASGTDGHWPGLLAEYLKRKRSVTLPLPLN